MTYYWHFARVDRYGDTRLGYGDNREISVGETLTVDGELVMCRHGLHASERIIDALQYAPDSSIITKVTLGASRITGADKVVANERTPVAMLDMDTTVKILREFARWCALQVIDLWDAPDVVREYLETGDKSLRLAEWTASGAASNAAWDASFPIACEAAREAASDAAWAAANDDTWEAARGPQNDKLTEMVEEALAQQEET